MNNLLIRAINLANAVKASDLSGDSLKLAISLADQIYSDIKKGFEPNIYDDDNSGLTRSEKEMIVSESTIIPAIKELRFRTNLGLKEAKDVVDRWRYKYMEEDQLGIWRVKPN